MEYHQFKNDLLQCIENGKNQGKISDFINSILEQDPSKSFSYRKASFSILKNDKKNLAVDIIEPAIPNLDNKFLSVVKDRVYDLIKSGQEDKRTVLKKVLLREIEIDFHKNMSTQDESTALIILSKQLDTHPYLSQTIYRRLARFYHKKNINLYNTLRNKLQE
ncbi:hypothetical protein [uncultured Shewanella sp.]|uniref:hypothetical protein n=1 Tax=uncultured Shewanella sp. TaxID=173975 RepID=UPI002610D959|nr:hypothetical protein [uncultured Shewanella sp.]